MNHKLVKACLLIVIAVLSRTVFHIGDNIELVTASTILSGSFLGLSFALLIPLTIMAVSDFFLGNSLIFTFTWSAYSIIGVTSYYFLKTSKRRKESKIVRAAVFAVFSSVFFYLWTNFGVWLLDVYGMYPKTLTGLIDAYIMGIPFLRNNLLGNLVFVPSAFIIWEIVFNKGKFLNLSKLAAKIK